MRQLFLLALFLSVTSLSLQQDWSTFSPSVSYFSYASNKVQFSTSYYQTSVKPTSNYIDSLWLPLNIYVFDYAFWIVNPMTIGTVKHFNLCDAKRALLQMYNYTSCDQAVLYWNETKQLNRTALKLSEVSEISLSLQDVGDWYLFDMCFYCSNTTSDSQLLQHFFFNTSLSTLWQNGCGGGDNLLVYAYGTKTICYCSELNVLAASCNSFQLFWVPLFFFVKDILYFLFVLFIILLSIFLVIIPRCVHIIKKTINRKSLSRKEQCTALLKAIFTDRNAIIVFAELCYLGFCIQPIFEIFFHWIVSYRVVKILPRFFGCLFWFCSSVTMLNIWVKSLVETVFRKEPKWFIAVRIISSVVPYIPVVVVVLIMFIVSYVTDRDTSITFGAAYLFSFSYVVVVSILGIILCAILFCKLRKMRKDIHLCSLRFTKYLFFSLFTTCLIGIVFVHEGLTLIVGPFTGEWFNLYNVLFVDIIVVSAATPYMYAAFSYSEWLQCYRLCCPKLPSWEDVTSKWKKKVELSHNEITKDPQQQPVTPQEIPQEVIPQEE